MQKSGKHRIFQFLTTSNNPLIYNSLQRFGCHQSVKDKNFESNSQQQAIAMGGGSGCHQSVKDKNFESNSQHPPQNSVTRQGCHQSVKDKNFESNSQPLC